MTGDVSVSKRQPYTLVDLLIIEVRGIPKECQADIDEEINTASRDDEDSHGRYCFVLVDIKSDDGEETHRGG